MDPRSHSRPLLPEEMDSIRRILSRNLHNFNNKVSSGCADGTIFPSLSKLWRSLMCFLSAVWSDRCLVNAADSSLQQTHSAPGQESGQKWEASSQTPQSGRETLVQHDHTLAAGTLSVSAADSSFSEAYPKKYCILSDDRFAEAAFNVSNMSLKSILCVMAGGVWRL